MAKKIQTPLTEIFIVLDADQKYEGSFKSLIDAQSVIDREELGNDVRCTTCGKYLYKSAPYETWFITHT